MFLFVLLSVCAPPNSTRNASRFPYTTLLRSPAPVGGVGQPSPAREYKPHAKSCPCVRSHALFLRAGRRQRALPPVRLANCGRAGPKEGDGQIGRAHV